MMNPTPSTFPASRAGPAPLRGSTISQPPSPQIPSEHTDIIHDTQFDYYGELLATASSDRTIGIYVARAGQPLLRTACLTGHEGPVWMVAWAHPRFGRVLASASFDRKVIVWKDVGRDQWSPVNVIDTHQGSVNAVCWAPEHVGPVLASASSDGTVAITCYQNGYWTESVKVSNNSNRIAHAMGATSVSFAPFRSSWPADTLLLASGGCDCHIRLWVSTPAQEAGGRPLAFKLHQALDGFEDWVRDVAFSPTCAASRYVVLASCIHNEKVVLFRKEWSQIESEVSEGSGASTTEWERSVTIFREPVWRLSWAPSGEMLLVTTASSEVFILQEGSCFTEPWVAMPLKDYQR